jgi:streptomycin 6-kinase
MTGIATEPVWQWGFVERVSTGLLCLKIGMNREGRDMLTVADAWSRAGPP